MVFRGYTDEKIKAGKDIRETFQVEGIDPMILEIMVTNLIIHFIINSENFWKKSDTDQNTTVVGYMNYVIEDFDYVDLDEVTNRVRQSLIEVQRGTHQDLFDHLEVSDIKGKPLELKKHTTSYYKIYWYIVNLIKLMVPEGLVTPVSCGRDYLIRSVIKLASLKYGCFSTIVVYRDLSQYLHYLHDPEEYHLQNLLNEPILKPSQIDLEDDRDILIEYDLQKYLTLCISAACAMGKTVGLDKILQNTNLRVLVITFRICQVDKHVQDWGKYGFKNYNKIETPLIRSEEYPRLVCQIDSLRRVSGHYDLIILDESEYTLAHLYEFVRDKYKVYKLLKCYLSDATYVMALDAQLSDLTLTLLRDCGRQPYVYFNTYPKHRNVSVKLVKKKNHFNQMVLDHLQKGLKVALPTNSDTYAVTITTWIEKRCPGLKVGLLHSKNIDDMKATARGDIVNIFDRYDFLVYTPVICAGTPSSRNTSM